MKRIQGSELNKIKLKDIRRGDILRIIQNFSFEDVEFNTEFVIIYEGTENSKRIDTKSGMYILDRKHCCKVLVGKYAGKTVKLSLTNWEIHKI